MTAQLPAFLQASAYGAVSFRQQVSSLFGIALPGTLTSAAGGIVNSGDMAVSQNGTPNMSVNVAGGYDWIPGTTAANQAMYGSLNDAPVNLTVAASNPSNPRIDDVCATINDAAYAGATNNFTLQVITGTPAGSPVAPSLPASSDALAHVAVAALATTIVTANIADQRSQVVSQLSKGIISATIATSQTATSSTPVDLGTVGPTVTLRTGTSALVLLTAFLANTNPGASSEMSIEVSGASSIGAPAGPTNLFFMSGTAAQSATLTALVPFFPGGTALTPGVNTFTAKYNASGGGTSSFAARNVTVIPWL
jgi:hypothetical protein